MKNQDKALLIGGVILAAGALWYFTRPETNYAPLPGQRGYGEGIGDGVVVGSKSTINLGYDIDRVSSRPQALKLLAQYNEIMNKLQAQYGEGYNWSRTEGGLQLQKLSLQISALGFNITPYVGDGLTENVIYT
jgi:hypothetical protein